MSYEAFLQSKNIIIPPAGFTVKNVTSGLFDFQLDIVKWALKRGRAAIFAGTGLGKSFMELSWADHIAKETKGNVLILTPLAVAAQMKREANKFGIEVEHVHEQSNGPIQITNYQKLDKFDLSKFSGVVLDESSILKNFNGHYRTQLINGCKVIPYRLAATATPSPNDYMELGNHSEFCGIMSYTDMLSTFFVHDGSETQQWRLKGHAEDAFWKWMASWSVMLENPSDLGYDGTRYILPKLHQLQHVVDVEYAPNVDTGLLFPMEACGLGERLKARRATINERVECAVELVFNSESYLQFGKFSDKLAVCGKQNTQKQDVRNTPQAKKHVKKENLNPEAATRTNNICETTTQKTNLSGTKKPPNKEIELTLPDEANMLLIQSLPSIVENRQSSEAKNQDEIQRCVQNSELDQQNTMQSSYHKTEDVPFVEKQNKKLVKNFQSITATNEAMSGEYFAQNVILESDTLITTQTEWKEQSNTYTKPDSWMIWCHLNDEQDAIEKAFGDLCFSIRGSDDDEKKERAVIDWIDGKRPIMISKMSILGFGMNFQHCHQTIFCGLNDSFEQLYQAVRRFWRFGQTKEVYAHFIAAEIEGAVVQNIKRKEEQCEHMMRQMVKHMADFSCKEIRGATRDTMTYLPTEKMELPKWI